MGEIQLDNWLQKSDDPTANPLALGLARYKYLGVGPVLRVFCYVHQHDVTEIPRDGARAAGLHGVHQEDQL